MVSTSGWGSGGSSEGADKKGKAVQKRDYRKGKQHKTYSVADKEKILNMIEAGARTCDIVKALGVPESSVRNIQKAKSEVKKNIESAKKYFPTPVAVAGTKPAHRYYIIPPGLHSPLL